MRWPIRKRHAPGWLAVTLGEGKANFAHVRPGSRPAVMFLEERSWAASEPKSLERMARQMDAQSYRCTTLLAPSECQLLQVEAPNVKREELKAALRWRVKDMIDYHVNDATIDVLDIPVRGAPQRGGMMYVIAARNDVVRRVMDEFAAARMPLQVIDIPDTAQRNIAALYESAERALLTLSFGADGGLITITAGGELYFSRRLEMNYSQVNAEGLGRERAFDRVLIEIQRSLDHFERSFSQLSIERLLIAPMECSAALVAHLAANIYVPVAAMDLAEVMDLPPAYAAAGAEAHARWFGLIGAGLRVEGTVL